MSSLVIYQLICPMSKETRYVGCCLERRILIRYAHHLCDTGNSDKVKWLNVLLHKNLKPKLNILERVSKKDWEDRERYWIAYYTKQGAKLFNQTQGGKGPLGYKKSESTKEKHRSLRHTQEVKEKIRKRFLGISKTEQHRENISRAKTGKPWTEHQRKVLKEVAIQNPQWHSRYRKGESNGRAILTEEKVREIRKLKGILPLRKIAEKYCICYDAVKRVLSNKTWSHVV